MPPAEFADLLGIPRTGLASAAKCARRRWGSEKLALELVSEFGRQIAIPVQNSDYAQAISGNLVEYEVVSKSVDSPGANCFKLQIRPYSPDFWHSRQQINGIFKGLNKSRR
jgi:hypothetical protein